MEESIYGYCPICGAKGVERDGNDKCENGHTYPAKDAVGVDEANKIKVLRRLMANDGKILDELIERMKEEPEEWT